jgi:hypothetical protein
MNTNQNFDPDLLSETGVSNRRLFLLLSTLGPKHAPNRLPNQSSYLPSILPHLIMSIRQILDLNNSLSFLAPFHPSTQLQPRSHDFPLLRLNQLVLRAICQNHLLHTWTHVRRIRAMARRHRIIPPAIRAAIPKRAPHELLVDLRDVRRAARRLVVRQHKSKIVYPRHQHQARGPPRAVLRLARRQRRHACDELRQQRRAARVPDADPRVRAAHAVRAPQVLQRAPHVVQVVWPLRVPALVVWGAGVGRVGWVWREAVV